MSLARLLDKAFQLQNQGESAEAEKLYRRALKTVRDDPALWFNHGLVLRDIDAPQKALASFDQALRLSPQRPEIENERASALLELGRQDDAMAALNRALAQRPLYAGALVNRGQVFMAMSRSENALADFDAALRLEPGLTLAMVSRSEVLQRLMRPAEALMACDRALAINPNDVRALNQRGTLLAQMERHEEALACFDRALIVGTAPPALHFNRAITLLALKRVEEAHAGARQLFAAFPDNPLVFDTLMETSFKTCDFSQRAVLESRLGAQVRSGQPPQPLRLLQYSEDPALQRAGAIAHVKNGFGALVGTPPPRRAASGRRLKVAYLSADFRNSAVAIFGAGLWERHDRGRFELFAVSTGPDDASPMRRRLMGAFEHFVDVRARSDEDVARLLAAAEIDILVDLGGHTSGARHGIAARRPAPIQVSYLGWAATSGSPFIDYLIADAVVAPPGSDDAFTEKLVRLAHCYHPTDPGRDLSAPTPSRAEAGLPEGAFVFCAFNGIWKLTPSVFRLWMELLHEIPGSVLWLRQDNDVATRKLRQEAATAGIAPERLVFAGAADEAEHTARHRLADLFVDTTPFGGHSTAIEALWAGLPVVCFNGASFASRVSASAVTAVGMPELATTSPADYKAMALKLARDPALLATYRARLEDGRMGFALFDATSQVRRLETAYEKMAALSRAGLTPQAFTVDDVSVP